MTHHVTKTNNHTIADQSPPGQKTLNTKRSQLEIFREDEQRVMSLMLSRLFAGKMTTRRRRDGDACSAIGRQTRATNTVVSGNFFFSIPEGCSKVRHFNL